MMKQSIRPTLFCVFGLLLLATSSVSAVVDFKVSEFGGGHQIWFEAEYFDERDPDNEDNFTLGNEPGAFGQSILSASGSDGAAFIRYSFDISNAGGAGGTWYFWGRVINPSNSSDFMLVEGDPGDADAFPIVLPTGNLGNGRRVFEENAGETGNWEWSDNDHDEGHTKTLRDGENTMYILNRQDGALWDVFMWTDDPDYVPTDEDYENASPSNPFTARSPSPGSNSGDVPWFTDELSWVAGESAETHNVYFSTNFADVNDRAASALVGDGLVATSQAIEIDLETTYYWAVDEVGGEPNFPVEAGATWNFTIEDVANPIDNVTATSDNQFGDGNGAEKTVDGSGMTDGLHGTGESDMWLSASLPATIQFDFDQAHALHEMHIWNQNQAIESLLGFGGMDVTVEISTNGTDFSDANFVSDVNVVDPLNQAAGTGGYAANSTIAFGGVLATSVRMTITSAYGFLGQAGLSEVRFSAIPAFPREFSPGNGSDSDGLDVDLSWRAGRFAVEHMVLASSDKAAVADGSALVATTADRSHTLTGLDYGSVVYTQIIDVAADGSTFAGPINLFFTPSGAALDDMESYTDEDGSRIWETWMDGTGNPFNGSVVGNGALGSAETDRSFEGGQSLPMHYGALPSTSLSSATRTYDPPLDLTAGAPDSLGIYFQGGPKGFTEDADGNISITASGNDIWNQADQMRYAYMSLSGDGSITARVNSQTDVHDWSKVGVMIRESATPESTNIFLANTGVNGVHYQVRNETGISTINDDPTLDGIQQNIARDEPVWLRVERVGNTFTGSYTLEEDPNTWTVLGTVYDIPMGADPNDPNGPGADVLIGLAATSHSVGDLVTGFISDVSTTGGVTGDWTVEAIGGIHPPSNDAAMVSLAVIDDAGGIVTVEHPDFAATNLTGWNLLDVPFSDLAGLDLTAVERIKLGVRMPFATGTLFADFLHVGTSLSLDVALAKLDDALGVSADDVVAFVEAEAADVLGASWRLIGDAAASGGWFIGSENGDGNDNNTAPGAEWLASYTITIPADGEYGVALRAQEAGSDSFWVRIVGATSQNLEDPDQPDTGWVRFNGIDAPNGWTWDRVHSNDHSNEAVIWTLPAGEVTVEIGKREDGTYVDAFSVFGL